MHEIFLDMELMPTKLVHELTFSCIHWQLKSVSMLGLDSLERDITGSINMWNYWRVQGAA